MDLDDITAAIAAGDLDGQLEQLVAAVVDRVRSGAVDVRWRIRFDGDEWTQDTITLGELKFAEQHCHVDDPARGRRRATRIDIDPRVYAEHVLALVTGHLHKVRGLSLKDAIAKAEAITAENLEAMVDEYEVVLPPKDGSPASTTS